MRIPNHAQISSVTNKDKTLSWPSLVQDTSAGLAQSHASVRVASVVRQVRLSLQVKHLFDI